MKIAKVDFASPARKWFQLLEIIEHYCYKYRVILNRIREYIVNNPEQWEEDGNNPKHVVG